MADFDLFGPMCWSASAEIVEVLPELGPNCAMFGPFLTNPNQIKLGRNLAKCEPRLVETGRNWFTSGHFSICRTYTGERDTGPDMFRGPQRNNLRCSDIFRCVWIELSPLLMTRCHSLLLLSSVGPPGGALSPLLCMEVDATLGWSMLAQSRPDPARILPTAVHTLSMFRCFLFGVCVLSWRRVPC